MSNIQAVNTEWVNELMAIGIIDKVLDEGFASV
jgi:hypothetical protein